MKRTIVAMNYRLYQILFLIYLVMSGHLIGLNEEIFRFGRGFFLLPTVYAVFCVAAHHFRKNWEYAKPKGYFLLAGSTLIPLLLLMGCIIALLVVPDAKLLQLRGFLFYIVIPCVLQLVILINYIICAVLTNREYQENKKQRSDAAEE